jgi:hypothetical protein
VWITDAKKFVPELSPEIKGDRTSLNFVSTVSVFVADQVRAKKFTEVLGFELRADAPLYPGAEERWIAVAPQGAQTEIILYLPDENWEHYRRLSVNPRLSRLM